MLPFNVERAKCYGIEQPAYEMSYGDSEDEEEPYDDEDAEKFAEVFCSNCPVRKLCLEYGKKYGNGFGVYGGLLPHERLGN